MSEPSTSESGCPRSGWMLFSPELRAADPSANYWMGQVTTRLRREIGWRWHVHAGAVPADPAALPPSGDRLSASLDLTRYREAKQRFFETDATARYLSDRLGEQPPSTRRSERGSFGWVVETLELDGAAAFTLALALTASLDHAAGPVIAACQNDPGKTQPTLGLAQQLWDAPEQALRLADPAHPLWRLGLLQTAGAGGLVAARIDWETPFTVAPLVAQPLLFPETPLPSILEPIVPGDEPMDEPARLVVARLRTAPDGLRIVPIRARPGAPAGEIAGQIAAAARREVRALALDPALPSAHALLGGLLTLCWLRGVDLLLQETTPRPADDRQSPYAYLAAFHAVPVTLFLMVEDAREIASTHSVGTRPRERLLPMVDAPSLSYAGRAACWRQFLGKRADGLERAIAESSRRFRYEKETIRAISAGLTARSGRLTASRLLAACRAEVPLNIGELAQAVTPRFEPHELVLPRKQQLQFDEIYQAMRALTQVHYGWGTARAWNESGISVLFAGAPGTGKTMAAEILAARLEMPMYRIDLSQVVNKYIGETEKNLKRLFDVADVADTILFFDEADALFGRRTEVRDAHDRYANLEISYLLERMERFKGLAILATNRRKDLDEAFLRRLRYLLEFPLPDVPQRKAIWMQVVPQGVDVSEVDFDFLARRFPLAGGHIRSIVFNACLQTANGNGARPRLGMEAIIVALKREYDKLSRSVTREQLGQYAALMEEIADE